MKRIVTRTFFGLCRRARTRGMLLLGFVFLMCSSCAPTAEEQLSEAVRNGNVSRVRELAYQDGVNLEAIDPDNGIRPLHQAVFSGQPEIARILLECGARIDSTIYSSEYTPLLLVSQEGSPKALESITVLLQFGANPEARTREGMNALELAATYGHLEVCRHLVENGFSVKGEAGCRVMEAAITWRYKAIVAYLLDQGVDPNAIDKGGYTFLMHVMCSGGGLFRRNHKEKLAMADFLLEKGADVNLANKDGITALMFAASMSCDRLFWVKYLVKAGANVNAVTAKGETALDLVWSEIPYELRQGKGKEDGISAFQGNALITFLREHGGKLCKKPKKINWEPSQLFPSK